MSETARGAGSLALANGWEFILTERERMKKPKLQVDRRLLGSWKSDKRQTFKWFYPKPGCPPEALRKLKALFGKLVVRWGHNKCHTDLDGCKDTAAYEVIASDADSVVVRFPDPADPRGRLRHIHFEGDHYWLWAGGIREYFKRVRQ
jgi:hypothetical protein